MRARICCWTFRALTFRTFCGTADEVLDEPQGGMDDVVGGDKVYHVDMVRKITHRCGSDSGAVPYRADPRGHPAHRPRWKPLFITTGDNYH